GHARADVVTRPTHQAAHAAGHVFTAVVASALGGRVTAGVAHGDPRTRNPRHGQLDTGGAIQAGVADDGGLFRAEGTARRRSDDQLAAGHALADIVVGVPFQVHVQSAHVPYPEALSGSALEAEGDWRGSHALVAVTPGDLAGYPGTDRTVAIGEGHLEVATVQTFDCRHGHFHHALGGQPLVEGLVALDLAVLRPVGRYQVAVQQRAQVQP